MLDIRYHRENCCSQGFLTCYYLCLYIPISCKSTTGHEAPISNSPRWETEEGIQGALAKTYQPRFLQSKEMTPFSSGNHFIPEESSKRSSQHTQAGRSCSLVPRHLYRCCSLATSGSTPGWPATEIQQSCLVFGSSGLSVY